MPRLRPDGAAARERLHALNPDPDETRYRALRARLDALLIALYERTALPVHAIARLAGVTGRAIQYRLRQLGCRPRNAAACRPGTSVGCRRGGGAATPLGLASARRIMRAFRDTAGALRANADARLAAELDAAHHRAVRRGQRTAERMLLSNARNLRNAAAALEGITAMRDREARAARHEAAATKPSRTGYQAKLDRQIAQQQALERQQQLAAFAAADRQRAAASASAVPAPAAATKPPALDPEVVRRVDAAAHDRTRHADGGPRVRRLW